MRKFCAEGIRGWDVFDYGIIKRLKLTGLIVAAVVPIMAELPSNQKIYKHIQN